MEVSLRLKERSWHFGILDDEAVHSGQPLLSLLNLSEQNITAYSHSPSLQPFSLREPSEGGRTG